MGRQIDRDREKKKRNKEENYRKRYVIITADSKYGGIKTNILAI